MSGRIIPSQLLPYRTLHSPQHDRRESEREILYPQNGITAKYLFVGFRGQFNERVPLTRRHSSWSLGREQVVRDGVGLNPGSAGDGGGGSLEEDPDS